MRAVTWRERYRRAGRDAVVLLITGPFPLHLLAILLVLPLTLLGLAATIVWIGLPVLALALRTAGVFAAVGRRTLSAVGPSAPRAGAYRRAEPGTGLVRATLLTLRDPQRWLDVLWVIVGFFVSVLTWSLAVTWLAMVILLPLGPLAEVIVKLSLRDEQAQNLAELAGLEPDLLWMTCFYAIMSVAVIAATPFVLRGLVLLYTAPARLLLHRGSQVARLRSSRAAVRRVEADTRRQLERDIHDGPQQRLVRLGMDLARAKRQVARDPGAAEEILTGAISQANETLGELRRLSRGIAPPVLVDRGLAAALSEIAARSSVPVTVEVEVGRLAEHVEQTAYFVASEALANLNKHSGAGSAQLGAVIDGSLLRLWVSDDGVGGARLDKGHGLAGLAERLEGVDGRLSVVSPEGGPTTIQAVIPCES